MRYIGAGLATALTLLIAAGSFSCLVTPRVTFIVLAFFAAVFFTLSFLEGRKLRTLIPPDLGFWLFLATGAYICINATWSEDFDRAFGKGILFVVFALLSIGSVRAVLDWPGIRARNAAKGLAIGLVLGGIYLFIEVLTDQALARAFFNTVPFIQPSDFKGMQVKDGDILSIRLAELNRGIALLLTSLWPLLLYLTGGRRDARSWLIVGTAFATTTLIIFLSEHNTSQIGIFITLAVFIVAYFLPRLTWLGVTAAWSLSFVVVVPLAIVAHEAKLNHAEWLPYSAQARIVLWSYTAHAIHDAPMLGIGGNSARVIAAEPEEIKKAKKAQAEGKAYAWQAGPHAHNQYLQTWYELGLVGVLLVMSCGAWVFWGIGRVAPEQMPYMLAHFTAYATLSASAWGMWQTWLMALPGLMAIYGAIAVVATRRPSEKCDRLEPS